MLLTGINGSVGFTASIPTMADKSNTTNATELLNKICSGGTITPQDLGTPTANTQATTYLTEGTTPLHFELNTQNKNKK